MLPRPHGQHRSFPGHRCHERRITAQGLALVPKGRGASLAWVVVRDPSHLQAARSLERTCSVSVGCNAAMPSGWNRSVDVAFVLSVIACKNIRFHCRVL